MNSKRKFTIEEARAIGGQLGIDQPDFSFEEFRRGLEVELEHGSRDPVTNVTNDDESLTGKIAWAHLKEFPDYYTRLDKLETEADEFWAAKGHVEWAEQQSDQIEQMGLANSLANQAAP